MWSKGVYTCGVRVCVHMWSKGVYTCEGCVYMYTGVE